MRAALAMLLLATVAHAAQPRAASYARQSSSGAPLIVAGRIDTAAVRLLSRFDDVTLELTPWAQDVSGAPRADVPLLLRQMNPRIRLWLYVLAGDQWLPPAFKPQAWDRSAFRDVFDAVNSGNGWLYAKDGSQWFENYRVNLGDYATAWKLGDVLTRIVRLRLFDGIFLDSCSPSIAWTSRAERPLDVERAGFRSLAAMDSARAANIELLIARLHEAGGCGFLVALNGTGPKPAGLDVDFREGLGSLITVNEAKAWMRTPGIHFLKMETTDCAKARAMLRSIGMLGRSIISAGPNREWPPCATYPEMP